MQMKGQVLQSAENLQLPSLSEHLAQGRCLQKEKERFCLLQVCFAAAASCLQSAIADGSLTASPLEVCLYGEAHVQIAESFSSRVAGADTSSLPHPGSAGWVPGAGLCAVSFQDAPDASMHSHS